MRSLIAAVACLLAFSGFACAQSDIEFVSYGDIDYRDNNFAGRTVTDWPGHIQDYRSHGVLESHNRFLLGDASHAALPRPYIAFDGSYTSRDVPPENRVLPGAGVEIRPFANLQADPSVDWFKYMRFYAQFSGELFLKSEDYPWYPRNSANVGAELWSQFGGANPALRARHQPWWAELYAGSAYYTTNFDLKYGSKGGVHAGTNIKYGTFIDDVRSRIMPYGVVDANYDTQSDCWQNRVYAGPGIRWELPRISDSRVWVYAEQRWIVCYPRDKARSCDHVLGSDAWIGLAYEHNLYLNY